ncbi:hypothetical protein BHM03_00053054, partial [Ensete ventricosum]
SLSQKECSNPSCPLYATTVAPAQVATTLACRQPLCQRAGPVAFATDAAPAGDTSMGAAPAGIPASGCPCKWQLLPVSVTLAGGCLCSLVAGFSHLR